MKLFRFLALILILVIPGAVTAFAQAGTTRERIVRVEGDVFLNGKPLDAALSHLSSSESSLVRTTNGRIAMISVNSDSLFVDRWSSVRLSASPLGSETYEVLSGSVAVITGQLGPVVVCQGQVQLSDAGVFKFDVHPVLDENFCRVRVYKGAAAARMPSFLWVLTSGRTVDLNRQCGDHIQRNSFDVEQVDALFLWGQQYVLPNTSQH